MRSTILLLLTLATTSEVAAQKVVRWTANGSTYRAKVESVDSAGRLVVHLGRSGLLTTLNPDTIPSLSIQSARAHSRGHSALIGMALGAAIGGVAGLASGDDQCSFGCILAFTAEEKAGVGAGLGATLGVLIGALAAPPSPWTPWTKGTTVARIHPTGGVNVAGDPKLGLQISF